MKLLIVIVNYRTPTLVVDCLRSLATELATVPGQLPGHFPGGARVVVVENASGDDSAAQIQAAVAREGWSSWVSLLTVQANGGFAAGNNAALQPALADPDPPDLLFLLNPDTIVRPGALAALVEFMGIQPTAGIAGCQLENPDGSLDRSAHPIPTPWGEFERASGLGAAIRRRRGREVEVGSGGPRPCGWVSGAALLVRAGVLKQIGLMDAGFFLYFEEVDLCERAWRGGWEVWHVPASRVLHLGGASTGTSNVQSGGLARSPHWYASRRRFFAKHYGALGLLGADVRWMLGTLVRVPLRWVRGRAGGDASAPRIRDIVWGDLKALWKHAPPAGAPAVGNPPENA